MIFETARFAVSIGDGQDNKPAYLVLNKTTGVVEFVNSGLYFVRDWATEMTKALDIQDWELEHPGLDYEKEHNKVIPFPVGGKNNNGGKSN